MHSPTNLLIASLALFLNPLAVSAHPVDLHSRAHENGIIHLHPRQGEAGAGIFPEINAVFKSNRVFAENIEATVPGLLKKLTDEGQSPQFAIYDCSDSRTSEGTIFNANPGTFFTQRNIANQFITSDPNSESVLAYGVTELGVKHIVVMGHYGCGGVAAAIASAPQNNIDAASNTIQAWIDPIRQLYLTSDREEIVQFREANSANGAIVEEPDVSEPAFRALVEENVKAQVAKIARSSIILNAYQRFEEAEAAKNSSNTPHEKRAEEEVEPIAVFIHGWVYDIETGLVNDLNITVSPPGVDPASLVSAESGLEIVKASSADPTTVASSISDSSSATSAETSSSGDAAASTSIASESEGEGSVTAAVDITPAASTAAPTGEVAIVEPESVSGNDAIVGITTKMVPVQGKV